MFSGIHLTNLWIFYVLAYAIALPMQEWANHKRGKPFDDPEFLFNGPWIFTLAMVWLISGLIISLFVPIDFGPLFYVGLLFYIGGIIVGVIGLYSFARTTELVKREHSPLLTESTVCRLGAGDSRHGVDRLVHDGVERRVRDLFLRDARLFPLDGDAGGSVST